MKQNLMTLFWAGAGIFLSVCVAVALILGLGREPDLWVDEAAAYAQVETMMESVRTQDYETLGEILSGKPDLGEPPETQGAAGMIWQAYLDSIQYTCADAFGSANSQLTLDVQLECLDIDAVTDELETVTPQLLARRAKETNDESEIYDPQHNYLESFLNQTLCDAVAQVLEQNPQTTKHQITLCFVREESGWKIQPNHQVQRILTGFVTD